MGSKGRANTAREACHGTCERMSIGPSRFATNVFPDPTMARQVYDRFKFTQLPVISAHREKEQLPAPIARTRENAG
jgi:hypothetical protein